MRNNVVTQVIEIPSSKYKNKNQGCIFVRRNNSTAKPKQVVYRRVYLLWSAKQIESNKKNDFFLCNVPVF